MIFVTILALLACFFSSSGDAWSQKNLPTVRIGIEAPAGTNSHYFVSKQLGLFQKHGINIELISFPAGTVGLQALFAGDIQFATSDGVAGLSANLRGANLYFIAGMINTFPFSILSRPEIRTPQELRGKKIVISRYGSSSDTAVRAAVEAGVDAANAQLARPEQIKRFALVRGDWLPGGDELTPTMKLKRRPILAKYEAEIEELYA